MRKPVLIAGLAALVWAASFIGNEKVWGWAAGALSLNTTRLPWSAVEFFVYDSVKLLLLLIGMIFLIGLLRTTISPERVRDYLQGRGLVPGLVLAALFGAVTPFCSCSSIPLFIGFVAAGIPLPITLTFLIASPLVNEVAVILLASSFGWAVTIGYAVAGLGLAVLAGFVFSRLNLERWVEDFVRSTPVAVLSSQVSRPSFTERIQAAWDETREILGRVWIWVLVGVGIGAVIHDLVPGDFFAKYAAGDNPLAVIVATLAGAPMYSSAAGVVPIAEALWVKGAGLGTVISFMMATVTLSLPEFVMLKKVMKAPLLGIFFSTAVAGIILIGLGFNALT